MSSSSAQLLDKIHNRSARVGVVGLGYVGLPLIVEFARNGFESVGIDLDVKKVAAINRGTSYILDTPSAEVAALTASGRLRATADISRSSRLSTPSTSASRRRCRRPRPWTCPTSCRRFRHRGPSSSGHADCPESTTYPGTTEEVVQPLLLEASGLKAGIDFSRLRPSASIQTTRRSTRTMSKIVGGMTPACSALANALRHGHRNRHSRQLLASPRW